MRLIITISILMFGAFHSLAQQSPSVHLLAKAKKGAILIRVAPGSPEDWIEGNKSGYILERFTIFRDDVWLVNKEKKTIHLKTLPLAEWEALADRNNFAAIAAEAIYGDDFEVTNSMDNDIARAYQTSTQLDMRYGFALFSADVSEETAQASGLFYRDTSVKENERYLYRLHHASSLPRDTALAYIELKDYFKLPKVDDVTIEFQNRLVKIKWSVEKMRQYYTAYWIERSDDGLTFEKTSDLPFINFNPESNKSVARDELFTWVDSLEQNNRKYYFRLIGISPFAENGPPSNVLEGQGYDPMSVHPGFISVTNDQSRARITWAFPPELEPAIKGFEIERSKNSEDRYEKISSMLASDVRTFVDPSPLSTNYYKVTALSRNGDHTQSFPVLYQPDDSIPPAVPTGMVGSIERNGLVKLSWSNNTEPDFLGYRVFRSNFKRAEFTQITINPTDTAYYVDTIRLDNLTSEIYYKLQAVDNRFNPSGYSLPLKIKKPDLVKPVQPVLKKILVEESSVHLDWIGSSSPDVKHHQLWIRDSSLHVWRPGKITLDSAIIHHKLPGLTNGIYLFRLEAVDSSDNRSFSDQAVAVITAAELRKPVTKIEAKVDRTTRAVTLTWEYSVSDLKKIVIYRAKENEPLLLYKTVTDSNRFVDTNLEMSTTYRYVLKAEFNNGEDSPFSKQVEIEY